MMLLMFEDAVSIELYIIAFILMLPMHNEKYGID